jgi:hypothetical protein
VALLQRSNFLTLEVETLPQTLLLALCSGATAGLKALLNQKKLYLSRNKNYLENEILFSRILFDSSAAFSP